MVWSLSSLVSLHWRCWDEEWVAFDVGSGLTHQMDTLTAVTLMMIDGGPVNVTDLILHLAEELAISSNQELFDVVNGILERLVIAGLIESTPQ